MPRDVTLTSYDVPSDYQSAYEGFTPFRQKSYTLRNRVSRVRNFPVYGQTMSVSGTDTTYTGQGNQFTSAIEYSYDIHGNVDSMLNVAGNVYWTVPFSYGGNQFKLIAYKYDLISGKVNEVHYNPGKADEFYHRYSYDAENRLTDVYTTDNKAFLEQTGLEEHDAHYEYYKHGPLARAVLGQQQVQGLDYAYTLQGWLKGVNSTSMNSDLDMGEDGKSGAQNQYVAKDEYGFNLNYYVGDYHAMSGSTPFPGHYGVMGNDYKQLFNGNIASMAVNIKKFAQPQLYNYGYDQLNRITKMDVYRGLSETANNWDALAAVPDYRERVSYDANGNILTYVRRGEGSSLPMDSLTYYYWDKTQNNRLEHIDDGVASSGYSSDLVDQDQYNYQYNQIGNLIGDNANKVSWINWNVYGKITTIDKVTSDEHEVNRIQYQYDPNGNRIQKDLLYNSSPDLSASHEWYVRDAQGNLMALYTVVAPRSGGTPPFILSEQYIYGSSRLGVRRLRQNMDSLRAYPVNANLIGQTYLYQQQRGEKFFELSNHLGNVLVTVSDRKYGVDQNSDGIYDYYTADVASANDYYPFGMQMPGRKYAGTSGYRYGFNGKENDNEVKGEGNQQDYGMRVYDPRAGKFLSVDPLKKSYPFYSPYHFAGNSPIKNLDVDGAEPQDYLQNWIYKPVFTIDNKISQRQIRRDNDKMYILTYDAVYDKVTNKYWFIYQDEGTGQYYYWQHKRGADPNHLIYSNINPAHDNGVWKPFDTKNKTEADKINSDHTMEYIFGGMVLAPLAAYTIGSGVVAAGTEYVVGKTVEAGTDAIGQYAATRKIDWADVALDYLPVKNAWVRAGQKLLQASVDISSDGVQVVGFNKRVSAGAIDLLTSYGADKLTKQPEKYIEGFTKELKSKIFKSYVDGQVNMLKSTIQTRTGEKAKDFTEKKGIKF